MISAADQGWIRVKSRHVLAHTILSLARMHTIPSLAIGLRAPLGVPAFIVGAGATLVRTGPLLPDCAARGLVFVTNSSDVCARHHGVATPHVLVVRESIDTSDQVASSNAAIKALDVSVHPATWDAAGGRGRWWLPCYPRHYELCRQIDVRPLDSGTASITAAISMAHAWGCSPIVLVGVDGAHGPIGADGTGPTYHPAAARGSMRWRPTEGGQRCELLGNESDDARHIRSGQKPPGKDVALEWLAAWGGEGSVPAISTLSDQVDWCATVATNWLAARPELHLVNANEGGARIPGWTERRLADVLAALPEHTIDLTPLTGRSLTRERCIEVAEAQLRSAAQLRFCAEEMTQARPLAINLVHGGFLERSELVESLGSADLLDAWTLNPNPGVKRSRAQAEAIMRAAEAGAKLLMEVLG